MGQALKIRTKRRKRKLYLERKKERDLTARVTSSKLRPSEDKSKKTAAPAPKKKPAKKAAPAKAASAPAKAAAPVVDKPDTAES